MTDNPREPCLCGNYPRFGCVEIDEDQVSSAFSCAGINIPGGGQTGCGRAGPVIVDDFAQRQAAARAWDRMIRRERQ